MGFSAFESEISQDAEYHVQFVEYVLTVFGKSIANVVAVVSDNGSTNKKMARLLRKGLVGCYSLRFNLVVQDLVSGDSRMIFEIYKLMKKLPDPLPAAKLRAHTSLLAKCNNLTRWSSTSEMLKRLLELWEYLPLIDDDDVAKLIPTLTQYRRIEKLIEKYNEMNSVTLALQRESINLADARSLLDIVSKEYPNMKDRLACDAKIVADPCFETG